MLSFGLASKHLFHEAKMKTLRLLTPFALLFFMACGGNDSAEMAEHEESMEESMEEMAYDGPNADLIAELDESADMLLSAIDGLTDEQWSYQESPERWSIAGVTEHIVKTEGMLLGFLSDSVLAGEPSMEMATGTDSVDAAIRAMMADRTNPIPTAPALEPAGVYASPAEAKMAFEEARAATVDFVKSTDKDLRAYSGQIAEGLPMMDGAQIVIFMAGHAKRHVAQIDQVKAHEGYPAPM
jgi:hypothetical protein